MNPRLITASDKSRAPRARFRSPYFKRMLAYPWASRKLLILSFAAAVLFAALHAASIGAVLPVLKLILADEGLHGWVDRSVASKRLGLELRVRRAADGQPDRVVIAEISKHHPSYAEGLRAGAGIQTDQRSAAAWLEHVATQDEATIELSIDGGGQGPDTIAVGYLVKTNELGWTRRAMLEVVSLVGRTTLQDRRSYVLFWVLVLLCGIVTAANGFRFLAEYCVSVSVLRAMIVVRTQLYHSVLRLPMSFFVRSSSSDTVSRFVQDVQEVQRGLLAIYGKVVREPLKALFILVFALSLDWKITLSMLALAPFAVAIFWMVGRKVKKANRRLLQEYGTMIGHLTTTLQAIDVVKAYTSEAAEERKMLGIDRQVFKYQFKLAILQALLSPLLEVLAVFGVAAVAVWLGNRVLRGELEPSEFLTLSLAMGMLLDPFRKLADVYTRVQRSAAGAERLFHLIDTPAESSSSALKDGGGKVEPLTQSIEYRDIVFTYPGAEKAALRGVNLTIAVGECVAIVGPNGSGKTTLINLLLRFYDPDEGSVLYDGRDLRELDLAGLRKNVALVTQSAVVFASTIGQNIAYGCDDATPERIEDAARRAFADDFIAGKKDGYQQAVGERGITLSGGERQRLVIARAIMRDAPILIFDEATSQVDTESDEKIHRAMRELARGRTTLMIAHRPSTIRFADRIVVMQSGQIADVGTHEELTQRCALYRSLSNEA